MPHIIYQFKLIIICKQILNKFEDALEYQDKAISINPNYDAALNNKDRALSINIINQEFVAKLNKFEDAIIQINPKNDTAQNNRELALDNLNRFQEAIECYEKAISINLKCNDAWCKKSNNCPAIFLVLLCTLECYDKAIKQNLNMMIHGIQRQYNVRQFQTKVLQYLGIKVDNLQQINTTNLDQFLEISVFNLKVYYFQNFLQIIKNYPTSIQLILSNNFNQTYKYQIFNFLKINSIDKYKINLYSFKSLNLLNIHFNDKY